MGLEIIIGRENASSDEFFLKDGDEVEQILGTVIADVIYLIWGDGKTVFAILFFRCMLHHTDDSLDDVIDIGEVALAIAVVEDLDGVALHQLVGEAEVGHVGTTGRTIDGEETQSCGRDVIQLGIGMSHQFVALLGGGIEGHWIIHLVVGGVRHFLVAAIDA